MPCTSISSTGKFRRNFFDRKNKTSPRLPLIILRGHLTPSVVVDDLNLVGKYIQCETVIPMNVYQVTTKVFELVLDNPFRGNANRALVALDISDRTAFDSF